MNGVEKVWVVAVICTMLALFSAAGCNTVQIIADAKTRARNGFIHTAETPNGVAVTCTCGAL
jgi:hypothetical protein